MKLLETLLPSEAKSGKAAQHVSRVSEPLSRLCSPTDASQPYDQWVQIAAQVLLSHDLTDPAAASRKDSEYVYEAVLYLSFITSQFNRIRALDEARWTANRTHRLAQNIVARHPHESKAHLALSEAFVQRYQNARETNDSKVVRESMEEALREAQEACRLDPDSETAHTELRLLERRLKDLLPKK
jgi:hypothetical protein